MSALTSANEYRMSIDGSESQPLRRLQTWEYGRVSVEGMISVGSEHQSRCKANLTLARLYAYESLLRIYEIRELSRID